MPRAWRGLMSRGELLNRIMKIVACNVVLPIARECRCRIIGKELLNCLQGIVPLFAKKVSCELRDVIVHDNMLRQRRVSDDKCTQLECKLTRHISLHSPDFCDLSLTLFD